MLLFKIFLAPVLILLVSLAGRKWGHGVSGWLLGLPLGSGPILPCVRLLLFEDVVVVEHPHRVASLLSDCGGAIASDT